MTTGLESGTQLADRILAEIQFAAPGALDRPASREQLRKRIHRLLSDAGYPSAAPERRSITLLQAEIHGFDELSDSYPATVVVNMLNRYLALMTEIISRYGGTLDKLAGNNLLVVFGAPQQQSDHVSQALACAVEMQQIMSRCNQQNGALQLPPLYVGIGVHSGEVVAGPIGANLRHEYTVVGSQVSLASRIAAQSLRGQVLISEQTYRLARDFVLVGEPGKLQLQSRRQPLQLYELLGTTKPRAMTVPRREVRKSPRVQVQMPCYFQRLNGSAVLETLHCGQVMDLSYHGLRMVSPVPLEAFGEIKVALSLQLLGARTSNIYARIIKAESDLPGYRCSMEFTDVDLAGQQAIKQFVDSQVCNA